MEDGAEPFGNALAQFLRERSEWRSEKAEEYPDDRRNARSAECLAALADYVSRLPADDEALRLLAAIHKPYGSDTFHPSTEGKYMISRFGFDRPVPPSGFGDFLQHLASAESEGAITLDHGPE
jgi:hypothetical protein